MRCTMARPVNDILKWKSVWVLFQQNQCNKEYVYFLSSVVDSRSTHKYEINITLTLFWVWSHVSSLKQIPAWMKQYKLSYSLEEWNIIPMSASSNKGGINKHALTCNILTVCRYWDWSSWSCIIRCTAELRWTKTLFADTTQSIIYSCISAISWCSFL